MVELVGHHLDAASLAFLAVSSKTLYQFLELDIPPLRKIVKVLVRDGNIAGLAVFAGEVGPSEHHRIASLLLDVVRRNATDRTVLDWVDRHLSHLLTLDELIDHAELVHGDTPEVFDWYDRRSQTEGVLLAEIRPFFKIAWSALETNNISLLIHICRKFNNFSMNQSFGRVFEKVSLPMLEVLNREVGLSECFYEPMAADRAAMNCIEVLRYVRNHEGRFSPEVYGYAAAVANRKNFEYLQQYAHLLLDHILAKLCLTVPNYG